MLSYADENGLRLFFVNSRDYSGSTPFTEVELEALGSTDLHVQATAIQSQGFEIAALLAHIITTHHIPSITKSKEGVLLGGLSVLSWSLGAIVPVSFLAHAAALPETTKQLLESHLRSVVLLGMSIRECDCLQLSLSSTNARSCSPHRRTPPACTDNRTTRCRPPRAVSAICRPNHDT